jgi:SAM-dependent methyltransferase
MEPKLRILKTEERSDQQIREHYQIEKELASRLRNSKVDERSYLYTDLYDQLYREVPHHSQLVRKSSSEASAWIVRQRLQLLKHFMNSDTIFLEIGAGDCSLSLEVAKYVKKVYAIDVSTEITKDLVCPDNFNFAISNGSSIPVPHNSIHIAYSHQLMEHLHPDDAIQQLENIFSSLAPGGIYICITPNRLSGPHDISKYFDEVATGFHLKEYLVTELYKLFHKVGFSKVSLYKSSSGIHIEIPLNPITIAFFKFSETLIGLLPYSLRRKIANTPLLFRGMTIVGSK